MTHHLSIQNLVKKFGDSTIVVKNKVNNILMSTYGCPHLGLFFHTTFVPNTRQSSSGHFHLATSSFVPKPKRITHKTS